MARLLLLIPTTSYRVKDFMNAAHKSGVNVTIGSDEESVLNTFQSSGILQLKFDDLNKSVEKIKTFHKSYPINSIIGVEEQTCLLAAKALDDVKTNIQQSHYLDLPKSDFLNSDCLALLRNDLE